jgi:hypothetical protein
VSATKVDALGGKVYASARRERQHERMARTKRATYSTSQRTSTPSTDSSTYCGVAVMASVVMTRTRRGRTARRRVPSLVRRHFHHARVPLRTPCRFTAATLEARASSTRCCHSDRDRRALLTATSGAPHASADTGVHSRTVTAEHLTRARAPASIAVRRRALGWCAMTAYVSPFLDLTTKEQSNVRAALQFLRRRCGGWQVLAKVLTFKPTTLSAIGGGHKNVSTRFPYRQMRLRWRGRRAHRALPSPGTCPICGHLNQQREENVAAIAREKWSASPAARAHPIWHPAMVDNADCSHQHPKGCPGRP